ncbi:unnamed protein product, partial [Prorocentrum cordatum]
AAEKGCDLVDWIGKQRADFFVGVGRDDVTTSEILKFESAVDATAMLGQLAQRHAERAQELGKCETVKAVSAKVPAANTEYHGFWHDPVPGALICWRCRGCNATARADHALRSLRTKEKFKHCEPTEVMSLAADCSFRDQPQLALVSALPNEDEQAAGPSEP